MKKTGFRTGLFALAIGLCLVFPVGVSADEGNPELSAGDVFDSTHWTVVHRWDFEGDLTDSVGGAAVSPLDCAYFSEPTYRNGKICLDGFQAYTFDQTMTFDQYEGITGLRVDILARMDFNTAAHSARRIFGCNLENQRTGGLVYINIPGAQYGSCSFALSTNSPAFNSFVMIPDQSKFDLNAENFYSFIYYNGMLYHFSDGILIASQPNIQGGKFVFTDFLGCSFVGDDMNYNFVGEIDFLQVSVFDPAAENDVISVPPKTEAPPESLPETVTPDTDPADDESGSSDSRAATDGDPAVSDKKPAEKRNSWILPAAAVVVVVFAVVSAVVAAKKKKN